MNNLFRKNGISVLIIIFLFASCGIEHGASVQPEDKSATIVEKFGKLSVDGNQLVDKNGDVVVLRGMSLFWCNWGGQFYTKETIKTLRDDWNCTVVRAALGIASDGFIDKPAENYERIITVIDAAIELGIYVIVDWHDHHAEDNLDRSKSFFKSIAEKYGHLPNIIYELYNEPLNVSWDDVIKPYAESVIEVIRQHDDDNLIIVGTPNWSQNVEKVIPSPIDDPNVAYTMHFYASTHKQWLRDKTKEAMDAGLPIFVSEWGLSEANGSGIIDMEEKQLWMDFLDNNNLSWCNWSVMNKDETSAAILHTTSKTHGWNVDELSESGKLIREMIKRRNADLFE